MVEVLVGEPDELAGEEDAEDYGGPVVPNGHHRRSEGSEHDHAYGHKHDHGGGGHAGHHHGDLEAFWQSDDGHGHECDDEEGCDGEQREQGGEVCDHDDRDVEIGRKRQVVGILVRLFTWLCREIPET